MDNLTKIIGILRNKLGLDIKVHTTVKTANKEYDQLEALRNEYLKADITEGIADLKAGNVSNGIDVLKRLRKRVT